jgi:hypothetical protein
MNLHVQIHFLVTEVGNVLAQAHTRFTWYSRIPLMQHLIVWHLRKVVPRPEIPPSITSDACTDCTILCWLIWTLLGTLSYYIGFKSSIKVSKQSTAGKAKHVTLTAPQKLEIIRRLESGKS